MEAIAEVCVFVSVRRLSSDVVDEEEIDEEIDEQSSESERGVV